MAACIVCFAQWNEKTSSQCILPLLDYSLISLELKNTTEFKKAFNLIKNMYTSIFIIFQQSNMNLNWHFIIENLIIFSERTD